MCGENLMSETLVKNYYTGYVRKEWRRLIKDAYHRLEFETTLHFLKKHFPKRVCCWMPVAGRDATR